MNKEISAQITKYLTDELGVDEESLKGDTPIFSAGLIDSMEMVNLLLYLETQFSIKLDAIMVSLEDLDTVNSITSLVERKR